MTIEDFINTLHSEEEQLSFEDTMATVEANFDFTPTAFQNGDTTNDAGQNSGSCKLFALAQELDLTKEQTLSCFGQYYQDVLNTPEKDDHQNIRNFMKFGWGGLIFEGEPLEWKQ